MRKRQANGQVISLSTPKPSRKRYTDAQKESALDKMRKRSNTVAEISAESGIPRGTLYKWATTEEARIKAKKKEAKKAAKKHTAGRTATAQKQPNRQAGIPQVTSAVVMKARDFGTILYEFVGHLAMLAAELKRRGI